MTSPGAVLDLIRREMPAQGRYAIVTAADEGPPMTVTVRFIEGGDTFQPDCVNLQSLPAVGARALIIPVAGRWVFAGVVTSPAPTVEYQTHDVHLVNNWHKELALPGGSWSVQEDYMDSSDPRKQGTVSQGAWPQSSGGGSSPVNPPTATHAHLLYHNVRAPLEAIAAAGGTVHLVEFVMTRDAPFAENAFVSPTMRAHRHTTALPPTDWAPPSWAFGYGPIKLAPVAVGQTARWALPVSWVTGLITGTLQGIGFGGLLSLRPAAGRDAAQFASDAGPRHARMSITYTAPTEVDL